MTNSEAHRQFYLTAAGVRTWYARRPLPGAAPSPEFSFPEETLPEPVAVDLLPATGNPNQPAPPKPAPATGRSVDLQALMTSDKGESVAGPELPESPSRPDSAISGSLAFSPGVESGEVEGSEVESREIEAAPASNDKSAPVSAHLGFWSSDKYLLVSQWSGEASERLQESLAQNMLRALTPGDVENRDRLQWPVFRNRQIPGNTAHDFQDVLERIVSRYNDHSVILLGVLSDVDDEQRKIWLGALLPNVGVDVPYSLAEMSASADYKRDLWSSLKSCFLR